MRLRRVAGAFACAAALGALAPVIGATPAAAISDYDFVATGLDGPYKLTFGPDDALYVAESGTGGTPDTGPCASGGGDDPSAQRCMGDTGAITRIEGESQERVVEGLPSFGGNGEASGPVDVTFDADGNMYTVIGFGGSDELRAELGDEGALLGTVLQVSPDADPELVADLVAWEAENDPDAEQPGSEGVDSNPFGIHAFAGGPIEPLEPGGLYAVDAGGNTLLRIVGGEIELVTLFPFREAEFPPGSGEMAPMQPVPTAVDLNAEGTPFVSELTGFPFPVDGANVYEIAEDGTPTAVEGQLTNIVDFDIAEDGTMYVLEFASNGLLSDNSVPQLVQIRTDGTRKVIFQLDAPPGGVTVGPDGMVYIATCTLCGPGAGAVLRFDPSVPSDPATANACQPNDVPGTEFEDIGGSVHREAIECITWFGLVRGTADDAFSPEGLTTRGQLATVLTGILEAGGVELPSDPPDAFSDDDGDVHEPAINQLAELDIAEGYDDDTFRPSDNVARDQMASFLARAYEAITGEPLPEGDDAFDDDEDSVHEDNINAVAAAGWAEGTDGESFDPRGSLTRGQLSSFAARMLSTLVEEGHAELPAQG